MSYHPAPGDSTTMSVVWPSISMQQRPLGALRVQTSQSLSLTMPSGSKVNLLKTCPTTTTHQTTALGTSRGPAWMRQFRVSATKRRLESMAMPQGERKQPSSSPSTPSTARTSPKPCSSVMTCYDMIWILKILKILK